MLTPIAVKAIMIRNAANDVENPAAVKPSDERKNP